MTLPTLPVFTNTTPLLSILSLPKEWEYKFTSKRGVGSEEWVRISYSLPGETCAMLPSAPTFPFSFVRSGMFSGFRSIMTTGNETFKRFCVGNVITETWNKSVKSGSVRKEMINIIQLHEHTIPTSHECIEKSLVPVVFSPLLVEVARVRLSLSEKVPADDSPQALIRIMHTQTINLKRLYNCLSDPFYKKCADLLMGPVKKRFAEAYISYVFKHDLSLALEGQKPHKPTVEERGALFIDAKLTAEAYGAKVPLPSHLYNYYSQRAKPHRVVYNAFTNDKLLSLNCPDDLDEKIPSVDLHLLYGPPLQLG